MNPLITALNTAGEGWTHHAATMAWQVGLLMTFLGLLDRLLAKRVPAVIRYGLWLLLPVKLLLPPSLALPTSPSYWLPRASSPTWSVNTVTVTESEAQPVDPALTAPSRTLLATHPQRPPQLAPPGWLLLAWLTGVFSLMAAVAIRARAVSRLVRHSSPAPAELHDQLHTCAHRLGLRRFPRLAISDCLSSPAVCGWLRPTILLPSGWTERFRRDQTDAVLLHELAHVQRGDLWANHLQTALQIAYWWHPLVWWGNARLRRVREEATDEAVVAANGGEAADYAATLVAVARAAGRPPALSLGMVSILESPKLLRRRIERLISLSLPARRRGGVAGWATVLIAGLLILPMAKGRETPAPPLAASDLQRTSPRLITRTWKLNPRTAWENLEKEGRVVAGQEADLGKFLITYLEETGFRSQPPHAIHYDLLTGKLTLRAEASDIELAEQTLERIARTPPQVLVETRFVSATDSVISELGWLWMAQDPERQPAGSGPSPSRARVLTARSTQELRRALNERLRLGQVGLLAAPRVTTLAGRRAMITQSEPTPEVHELQAPSATNRPTRFSIDVTPEVEDDPFTLRLSTVAQVTERVVVSQGGSEPIASPSAATPAPTGTGVYAVNAVGYIEHQATNVVRMFDGQSLLVPLGRQAGRDGLFTPNSQAGDWLALLVTPRLIDPAGNPVHAQADLEAIDRLPDDGE